MQAIVETIFDTVYLFSVITIGILMIRKSKGNRQFTMFGIMAVILGSGDAFHLVPRAAALCTRIIRCIQRIQKSEYHGPNFGFTLQWRWPRYISQPNSNLYSRRKI